MIVQTYGSHVGLPKSCSR